MSRVITESRPVQQGRRRTDMSTATARAAAPRFRLERELAAALRLESIGAHYQPQYDLATGLSCGVEALARWQLPSGDHVPPSIFIPVAERIGMIQTLGSQVLTLACTTMRHCCGRDATPLTLAVNVSALQINDAFGRILEHTLDQCRFPASQLELEITESALIGIEQTTRHLHEWKRLGVRIALDDFGTGYSSLNYLSRLPVDRLKIDRLLVQQMPLDPKSASIVRFILSLTAELGLDVIAEGVETELELRMLADLGCQKVQGYLLAQPAPAQQAQLALAERWGNRPKPARH
jgi:EAL domain-containing protein (putative c-di-GMP-specific phosphodiesterase class I)